MASFEINPGFENWINALAKFGEDEPEIAKDVVMAGAQPVANEIRYKLENLPDDTFRRLKSEEKFEGVPHNQWKDLMNSLGIAPPSIDEQGNTNTKVGFKGYGSFPSHKYPKGLPNALLARAIESGSTVRKKTPFVRPAVNKTRNIAIDEMQKEVNHKLKIYAL